MLSRASNKSLLILAMCSIVLLFCAIQSSEAAGDQIVLRFAGNLPADHFVTRNQELYAKLVESKTKGRVKIEIYPAGQLFSDKDLVKALPMGAVDMAEATCAQWTGIEPLWLMLDLPLFYKDRKHWHRVLDSEVGKMLQSEFEKKTNVKFLYFLDYGATGQASKTPLRTLEDYKGKRIRGTGEVVLKALQAMGAAPVFLGGGEVYLALQRGTIDAANSGMSSFWERKYYEVTKFISGTDFTLGNFFVGINKTKWQSLPADIQKAMLEAAEEAKISSRIECEKSDNEAMRKLREKGVEIYDPPPKEKERWRQATKPVAHSFFISRGGDKAKLILQMVEKID
ncbi:MAG: C4-dicarboxylate-binding periplasmic protein precursor [Syntrophorhabdus sp. PtaU1.Bin058]|nr:MAG: C4-dicarboxylate-binding periplasmic protein precursor [Syntrophorhabdus sp. PtaU1.Bin058]